MNLKYFLLSLHKELGEMIIVVCSMFYDFVGVMGSYLNDNELFLIL